jgi:hypothetical protein
MRVLFLKKFYPQLQFELKSAEITAHPDNYP